MPDPAPENLERLAHVVAELGSHVLGRDSYFVAISPPNRERRHDVAAQVFEKSPCAMNPPGCEPGGIANSALERCCMYSFSPSETPKRR